MPPGLPPPTLCGEGTICRRGALLGFTQDGFVVPTDYHGAPGMQPYGALAVYAAATAETADRLGCPQGPSVLLRWSEQGVFVVLAVLGSSQVNQRLIIVLADHLRLIPPRS